MIRQKYFIIQILYWRILEFIKFGGCLGGPTYILGMGAYYREVYQFHDFGGRNGINFYNFGI